MFPTRYFPDRYFAPRYFPKDGVAAVATPTSDVQITRRVRMHNFSESVLFDDLTHRVRFVGDQSESSLK